MKFFANTDYNGTCNNKDIKYKVELATVTLVTFFTSVAKTDVTSRIPLQPFFSKKNFTFSWNSSSGFSTTQTREQKSVKKCMKKNIQRNIPMHVVALNLSRPSKDLRKL